MTLNGATTAVRADVLDAEWILALYKEDEQYGGALGWWRYWHRSRPDFHARSAIEHFLVLQPQIGFIHWRRRHDGVSAIDGLAITPAERRKGHGTYLLNLVTRPIEIKVLTTAVEARAFCMAMGLQPMAKIQSSRGSRVFILFRGD